MEWNKWECAKDWNKILSLILITNRHTHTHMALGQCLDQAVPKTKSLGPEMPQ